MAGSFKNRRLVFAYPSAFKKQSAWDTAIANADIDKSHPNDPPVFPGRRVTREETRDCKGEYIVARQITSRLWLVTLQFDVTAYILAGWLAYAYGAAAAPTGSPADEAQTLTIDATAGTFTISFAFEGLSDTSAPIAFNATAAQIQAAIEALRSVKAGNIAVTSTGPFTITGAGKLAKANLPLFTTDASLLTGGAATAVIAASTNGVQRLHAITRGTSDQPPQTSVIVGFEGDSTPPNKYKNIVVNRISVTGALRGKVRATVELIGSAEAFSQSGYTLPACVTQSPLYTRDCRVYVDGVYYVDTLREFNFEYSNNIFSNEDPFPFDDIDPVRLERGDRTSTMGFTFYGSEGDLLYGYAASELTKDTRLLLGPPGDRVLITAPSCQLSLPDNPITFAGEANRSAFALNGLPFFDNTVAGTPDKVDAYVTASSTFLAT